MAFWQVVDELPSDGCYWTLIDPWQRCHRRVCPACNLCLGRGPKGTEALGQRDEWEAKNKVGEKGESNTSCMRVQSGVKCQHFAARRFLCTYILVDKVSCAFFFFSLIWKGCSAEKGIRRWECFIFKCFYTELLAFHQYFNHFSWVSPKKSFSFKMWVNTTTSKRIQHS